MKKLDLPLILDVLFYSFCAFLLSVGVLRYVRAAAWAVFTVSVLLALAVALLCSAAIGLKHRRRAMGQEAQKRKDALMLHLTLAPAEDVVSALAEALRTDGKEAEKEADSVVAGGMRIVPLFTMQPVSADAVAVLLKRYGKENFAVACNRLSAEADGLLKTFGKKSLGGEEIFSLFDRTGTTPSPLICGELPRFKWKAKLRRTFSKKNARPFFVSGSLLLLMSLFTLFPLYYLITGSVLLFAAVCVRLLGYA